MIPAAVALHSTAQKAKDLAKKNKEAAAKAKKAAAELAKKKEAARKANQAKYTALNKTVGGSHFGCSTRRGDGGKWVNGNWKIPICTQS